MGTKVRKTLSVFFVVGIISFGGLFAGCDNGEIKNYHVEQNEILKEGFETKSEITETIIDFFIVENAKLISTGMK